MGLISNGTTLLDAGAIDGGVATGAMTLITSTTLSSAAANITFASGINSTYKEYVFKFIDIHPATDDSKLLVNFRDGSTAYDATKTTTLFRTQIAEGDSGNNLAYRTDDDLAQSTGAQPVTMDIGNGNDESACGFLILYNPSDTTFVKHFVAESSCYYSGNYAQTAYIGGYCNVTAAIDGVQFTMEGGTNMDSGTIKMYGIK
jgi:hypothetical protein